MFFNAVKFMTVEEQNPSIRQQGFKQSTVFKITASAIFIALVFVTTTILRIPIPATGGNFNLGDSVIFAAALLYGPMVGGVAGGVGAAISDAIGFPIFAPGTLIIKFFEGLITGYLEHKIRPKNKAVTLWKVLSIILGVVLGVATYYIGTNYMGVFGNALLDQILWGALALFLTIFIILMSFTPQTETSGQTTAIIIGGTVMVIGYFLYENLLALLIPSLGILAIAEIPANIGQMLVGMVIALPVIRAVKKTVPSEQKN
jgi:uncharacterized membrane protein